MRIFGVAPAGFGGGNGTDPVGESFGRRQLSGHVGIIKMAVGVDEAWQEHHVAEVKKFFLREPAQFAPRRQGIIFVSVNKTRALLRGRRGEGKNDFGAEDHSASA